MLHGLWKLTWIETKIFLREPMGALGSIGIPVLAFVVLGRAMRGSAGASNVPVNRFVQVGLPVFASILIALSAVTSLVTIVCIYREGGILKRLRVTPLRPWTILTAHVIVKLLLTLVTLVVMVAAGRRYAPIVAAAPPMGFALALLIATCSILSVGFVIASIVPTARFAQPITAALFYPMVAVSGLFVPLAALPPAVRLAARALPLTYAVSLLQGIWQAEPWSAHLGDVAALVTVFLISTALSAKVFRWE